MSNIDETVNTIRDKLKEQHLGEKKGTEEQVAIAQRLVVDFKKLAVTRNPHDPLILIGGVVLAENGPGFVGFSPGDVLGDGLKISDLFLELNLAVQRHFLSLRELPEQS